MLPITNAIPAASHQNPPVARFPSSLTIAATAATVPTRHIKAEKMDSIMGDESHHLKRKMAIHYDRLVDTLVDDNDDSIGSDDSLDSSF
jgi:hypothetical protein